MEDLRVTDRNAPDWIALAEVKGFNRGASPRGGTQLIGRPVQAYVTETGRLPGGLWYFVNHLIDTPPGQRPQPLERDSIADTLAQRDGALIDTRDLLRAVLAVRRGEARPEQVRASMRASRGRWHWPEAELPNSSR